MNVRIVGEFDTRHGHGYVIPYVEGECEPPMINNASQVFVQHGKRGEGILITEPENVVNTLVIERVVHCEGELLCHGFQERTVARDVKNLVIEF